VAGTLVGLFADPSFQDHAVTLGRGDAVVLYTDGVTEARSGSDIFGEERLREMLAGCAGLDAEAIASRIEDAVESYRDDGARDDVALLVLRVRP
jgi:phosphoserine phosphatase RsbU/P